MAEETRTLEDLKELAEITGPAEPEAAPEPKIDAQGRAYATGKRKNAIARVWIKRGMGSITVNGRDQDTYFARPVLRMLIHQPFLVAEREKQFDVICTVRGGGLSGPLQESGLFPPIVTDMLAIGEESGKPEVMLSQLARYYDLEIRRAVERLVAALGPALILFMAGIVVFIALSIVLPIFNLSQALARELGPGLLMSGASGGGDEP